MNERKKLDKKETFQQHIFRVISDNEKSLLITLEKFTELIENELVKFDEKYQK